MLEYAENLPAELAAQRKEKIRKAGNNVWFAWAGTPKKVDRTTTACKLPPS